MKIEDLAQAVEALAAKIDALVSVEDTKAAEQAQVEADEAAVEAALDAYDAQIEKIEAADLTPVQVESLRALARKGLDVSTEIENAKRLKAEIAENLNKGTEPRGRFNESTGTEDYVLKGFKESK